MTRITILLLLFATISFGQTDKSLQLENEFKAENSIDDYNSFDFSQIWIKTENIYVLGIMGKEHQRIQIKLISVKKDINNPNEYFVFGKSRVKGTICDFNGIITLIAIKKIKEDYASHFGVEHENADKVIKSQGILIADYEFHENNEQKRSGIFKCKLYSKWYLNSNDQMEYDNIESISDGYLNNAFIGIWKSYTTEKEKICNWADFRVPEANLDFDVGAGGFSPSKKYYHKGWENYQQAWLYGNEQAKKMELEEWWK